MQLDAQLRNMYWLTERKSNLSVDSKIAIYKTILKPVWTYGIQLWGSTSNSNIEILERFQTKIIRTMLDIPHYISNKYILNDLKINSVRKEINIISERCKKKLQDHQNTLASTLLTSDKFKYRRLKRQSILILPTRQ